MVVSMECLAVLTDHHPMKITETATNGKMSKLNLV